ncbi:FLYWCH zinc finger domain-containing protein [Phthorimaea operculella]|nr:FLYWCH zinc finger domain-containing protein [Phthorimaea operculella]
MVMNSCAYCRDLIPVFTINERGNPNVHIGSYKFIMHSNCKRTVSPKRRWVCSLTSRGCRASVTTIDDVIVHCRNDHNH